ncbi:restriction endonuclease [Spiractinospora alimapuensis]|uniref:restriction endonuclease n=1 Tax=Spiractinospora alimapuensis TaxID=2820884 RepID=UPI001F3A2535|nr:restriction endonuclease [Spiractinospora alimapuensis]QVQ52843.1 restriction endonuclease [Spiractinospora alimapuensis]
MNRGYGPWVAAAVVVVGVGVWNWAGELAPAVATGLVLAAVTVGAATLWARHRLTRWRSQRAVERTDFRRIDAMTGVEFEHFVADLMRRDGFSGVVVVGRAGDGGVDIRARTPGGRRCAVQCKRLKRAAQPKDVREFIGVLATTHRDYAGMMVSANGFTSRAAEEAAGYLTLVGRAELAEWKTDHRVPVLPPR